MPGCLELRQGLLKVSFALALIRDRSVPVQSQGFERTQDEACRAPFLPGRVDVLDPHQPLAASCPRLQIATERRDQRTEVERAGRGRCKAATVGGG